MARELLLGLQVPEDAEPQDIADLLRQAATELENIISIEDGYAIWVHDHDRNRIGTIKVHAVPKGWESIK